MEFLTANTKSLLDSNLEDGQFHRREGQARHRHRRRRHRRRLHRHLAASRLQEPRQLRAARSAAREARGRQPLAAVAEDLAHRLRARGVDRALRRRPAQLRVVSKEFRANGHGGVGAVKITRIEWQKTDGGAPRMVELDGTARRSRPIWSCSRWASGPEAYVAQKLGVELDGRSNYKAEHGKFATSVPGVFAAGDCRRGQSLVVWAINEGRGAARAIDQFLMGSSLLPAPKISLGGATS